MLDETTRIFVRRRSTSRCGYVLPDVVFFFWGGPYYFTPAGIFYYHLFALLPVARSNIAEQRQHRESCSRRASNTTSALIVQQSLKRKKKRTTKWWQRGGLGGHGLENKKQKEVEGAHTEKEKRNGRETHLNKTDKGDWGENTEHVFMQNKHCVYINFFLFILYIYLLCFDMLRVLEWARACLCMGEKVHVSALGGEAQKHTHTYTHTLTHTYTHKRWKNQKKA